MERIEKICAHTGVTAELAQQALEESNGCMLEAVLLLEQKGCAKHTDGGRWSTTWNPPPEQEEGAAETAKERGMRRGVNWRRTGQDFAGALKSLLRNCTEITIDVWRRDELLVGIPLIICVLLFLVAPYAMIPLTIVGLALRCRYHISGWDFGGEETINRTMDQVTDTVADWSEQVWHEVQDYRDKHK